MKGSAAPSEYAWAKAGPPPQPIAGGLEPFEGSKEDNTREATV
jgi:hypothetical protein